MMQAVICVLGVLSVYLSQHPAAAARRYACIAGFMAQPLWVYVSISAQQWGFLVLSFVYGWLWGRSLWREWLAVLIQGLNENLFAYRRKA